MKDCTTCKFGYEDEQMGFPMCHHPKRFSVDCVDFNMHEEKEIKEVKISGSSEIPKELKEASEKEYPCDKSWMTDSMLDMNAHCQVAFWKGAKWDREQMMKDGLDAVKTFDFNKVEKTIAGVFVKYGMDRQKELMMEEAVDVHIAESFNPVSDNIGTFLHGFSCTYEVKESTPYMIAGEHVKIIFVKED